MGHSYSVCCPRTPEAAVAECTLFAKCFFLATPGCNESRCKASRRTEDRAGEASRVEEAEF